MIWVDYLWVMDSDEKDEMSDLQTRKSVREGKWANKHQIGK